MEVAGEHHPDAEPGKGFERQIGALDDVHRRGHRDFGLQQGVMGDDDPHRVGRRLREPLFEPAELPCG